VVLQLLAVKLPQTFKRLYFTTRFYTFEPLKTVPAVVCFILFATWTQIQFAQSPLHFCLCWLVCAPAAHGSV
jgi:hypothetical protein